MRLALCALALFSLFPGICRAADDDSIFVDDFKVLDPGWGAETPNKRVANGKLVIQPERQSGYSTVYAGHLFGDADISVKFTLTAGQPDQTAGLVFWAADTDTYYVAQISAQGLFGITRWNDGQQVNPISYDTQPVIKQGLDATNELRVVTIGNRAAVFVNGQQLVAFKGFPPAEKSRLGLHAESGETQDTWQFSDFRVRKPDPKLLPAEPPPSDSSILLTDDFSSLDPSWGSTTDVRFIEDGALTLKPKADTSYTSTFSGALFDDVDIRLKVRAIEGDPDETAGVAFWVSPDQSGWYQLEVQPNGLAGVARRTPGGLLVPVTYKPQPAVKKGFGQENEVRVVTLGNRAAVFVNGQQFAVFQGYPPSGGSLIGLHAESGEKQNTWRFSGLEVRKADPKLFPAAASAPPSDPSILFVDDFATLDPSWSDADKVMSGGDGKLVLKPEVGTSYADLYSGAMFTDADIRAQVTLAEGQPDQPAGIIFWATDFKNYYVAQINPRGLLGVSRVMDGSWAAPVGYFPHKEVLSGEGKTNELRVVTKGKQVTVYVNDKEITSFQGFPPEHGGRVGVRATSGQKDRYTWQFTHYTVRRVP